MANMSYCRFRNTALALSDCKCEMEEMAEEQSLRDCSHEEISAMRRMKELCEEFLEFYEDLEELIEAEEEEDE